jgi:hypothetical protein
VVHAHRRARASVGQRRAGERIGPHRHPGSSTTAGNACEAGSPPATLRLRACDEGSTRPGCNERAFIGLGAHAGVRVSNGS